MLSVASTLLLEDSNTSRQLQGTFLSWTLCVMFVHGSSHDTATRAMRRVADYRYIVTHAEYEYVTALVVSSAADGAADSRVCTRTVSAELDRNQTETV